MGSVVTTTAGDRGASNVTPLSAAATQEEIRQALSSLELESPSAGQVLRTAEARTVRKQMEVPIVSGMLLGGLLGLAVMGWQEAGRRRPPTGTRAGSARVHRRGPVPAQPGGTAVDRSIGSSR